jgi:hypothetical protein
MIGMIMPAGVWNCCCFQEASAWGGAPAQPSGVTQPHRPCRGVASHCSRGESHLSTCPSNLGLI